MTISAELGLAVVVLVILLARRAGGDWRPAGRVLGVATMAFVGVIVLRAVAGSEPAYIASVAFTALGWIATVIAAMIAATGD